MGENDELTFAAIAFPRELRKKLLIESYRIEVNVSVSSLGAAVFFKPLQAMKNLRI
jgi:hypothetical protein